MNHHTRNELLTNAGGFIGSHGLATNTHRRAYLSGAPLSFSEKVTIGNAYLQAREDLDGVRPNITVLARACKVARAVPTTMSFVKADPEDDDCVCSEAYLGLLVERVPPTDLLLGDV